MKTVNDKYAIVMITPHFNGLGIVRSLGEVGIPSVCISSSSLTLAQFSKYTIDVRTFTDSESVYQIILDVIDKYGGRPAIFPTADAHIKILNNIICKIKDITYCPSFSKLDFNDCLDKDTMSFLAQKSGFNVPETIKINMSLESDIARIYEFGVPLIIKPLSGTKGAKDDIRVCLTKDELDDAINLFTIESNYHSDLLIQRYVYSNNEFMVEYCGCKTIGNKVLVNGQLRKIREYPVNRGSTSYAVIDEEINYIDIDCLDIFLNLSGFSGVFDLEIKVVDDIPYFIEINYRNGAPSYAFTRSGFNIPELWYKQITGEAIPPISIKRIHLMCEGLDLSNLFDKNISPFKWLYQFFSSDVHMIFNKHDILPLIKSYKFLVGFIEYKFYK